MERLKKFIKFFIKIIGLDKTTLFPKLIQDFSVRTRKESFRKLFHLFKRNLGISIIISFLKLVNNRFNTKYMRFYFDHVYDENQKHLEKKGENKIIGYLLTWNNLEFFKHSFDQALEFCDELFVVEGCHYKKYPKRSNDGTVEYLNKIKKHPKLKIFDFSFKGRNDVVQLKIRLALYQYFKYLKPGSWVVPWDDDFFFFNKDLIKLKEILKNTECDRIIFKERRFIYNFRFNTFSSKKGIIHMDRITKGGYVEGKLKKMTHPRYFYKNGIKYNKILYLDDIVCFHYPFVKQPDRLKARWEISVEKGNKDKKYMIDKYMAVKWTIDQDVLKYKRIIEKINVEKGFNIYNGKHPEILDTHPWRYIKDIRKIN